MSIYIGDKEIKDLKIGTTTPSAVYLGENKVRPVTPPYLCFTAEQANSTVKLQKNGSLITTTLETSTDGATWNTYTFGSTITLTNIGDKVYWRNTSETDTSLSFDTSNRCYFVMTGSIAGSGELSSLLNKNLTDTIQGSYCFYHLFYYCNSLNTPPKLSFTTLTSNCYDGMFMNCTNLKEVPSLPATTLMPSCYASMFSGCTSLTKLTLLPATTLESSCYNGMFRECSKIKLSTTQTGEYQTEYRIPTTGTGTTATAALNYMFSSTGGTFTGTPTINRTYYTSNTVV